MKANLMKRAALILMSLCLAVSICGCTSRDKDESKESSVESSVEESAESSKETEESSEAESSQAESSSEASAEGGTAEEEAYKQQITDLVAQSSSLNSDVTQTVSDVTTALDNKDAEAYQTAVDTLRGYCNQLEEIYSQIGALEAPAKYQSQQAELKQYGDDMNLMLEDSMELYDLAGQTINSTATTEQQTRMTELTEEITSLEESATKFADVIDEILELE